MLRDAIFKVEVLFQVRLLTVKCPPTVLLHPLVLGVVAGLQNRLSNPSRLAVQRRLTVKRHAHTKLSVPLELYWLPGKGHSE